MLSLLVAVVFMVRSVDNIQTTKNQTVSSGINEAHILRLQKHFVNGDPTKPTRINKFKEYLKKYEPLTIWEAIDKQRKLFGRNISDAEQIDLMVNGMDATDELFSLKLEKVNPELLFRRKHGKSKTSSTTSTTTTPRFLERGWRYKHYGLNEALPNDRFSLSPRLYELMKHAIYQTREKMVTMQRFRKQYKNSGLYKMGFLISKADNIMKTFGIFSIKSFRGCLLAREKMYKNILTYDWLVANERQLNLWMNLELLIEVIKKNDVAVKKMMKKYTTNRTLHMDKLFFD